MGFGICLAGIMYGNDGATSLGLMFINLLSTTISQIDPVSITLSNLTVETIAQIILLVFGILTGIILINLLIARMTSSYERTMNHAFEQWSYVKAKTVYQYLLLKESNALCMLPPPLNILPLFLLPLHLIIYYMTPDDVPAKEIIKHTTFQNLMQTATKSRALNSKSVLAYHHHSYNSLNDPNDTKPHKVFLSISGTCSNFIVLILGGFIRALVIYIETIRLLRNEYLDDDDIETLSGVDRMIRYGILTCQITVYILSLPFLIVFYMITTPFLHWKSQLQYVEKKTTEMLYWRSLTLVGNEHRLPSGSIATKPSKVMKTDNKSIVSDLSGNENETETIFREDEIQNICVHLLGLDSNIRLHQAINQLTHGQQQLRSELLELKMKMIMNSNDLK
jgi:hypothetical protein